MKWDGPRAITTVDNGVARMFSRNGNDITATFPCCPPPHSSATRRPSRTTYSTS
ncbi:hypothetical protein [Rhodococcus opacus]|uniref:hypothetical protein n=1 Tax=Rhodococcus opacus TaxID=37919 RepID=UPI001E626F36|nr:hypothetical protein [Rhodococcus opacus]